MSFGKQSDVHNHLSTKQKLFTHKLFEEEPRDRISELVCDEDHSAERGPPVKVKVEEPLVRSL
jgi:hypothetical protein